MTREHKDKLFISYRVILLILSFFKSHYIFFNLFVCILFDHLYRFFPHTKPTCKKHTEKSVPMGQVSTIQHIKKNNRKMVKKGK